VRSEGKSVRNSLANTRVKGGGRGGDAPGTGAAIPLQPLEKTMMKQIFPLQPVKRTTLA